MKITDYMQNLEQKLPQKTVEMLSLLEQVNPCKQAYHFENKTFMISYQLNLDILNFAKKARLRIKTHIIGMPVSVSLSGYLGKEADVEQFIRKQKGLWVVLNADKPFSTKAQTLSTFIFQNNFQNFDEYLAALRSPYRRRMMQALKKRDKITIEQVDFTDEHYALYKNVVARADHPLEVLPKAFFDQYSSEIHEFRAKDDKLLAFVQIAEEGEQMAFLFCGFKKEDVHEYDLYYNMLLWVIECGIKSGVRTIDFGQTSEESKLKIGCVEQAKYMYIHHHNPLVRKILLKLLPFFAYKPYPVIHHVFKEETDADIS